MTQKRAEQIAEDIVDDYLENYETSNMRETIIRGLLKIEECNGCPSISEALNMGDGSYKP